MFFKAKKVLRSINLNPGLKIEKGVLKFFCIFFLVIIFFIPNDINALALATFLDDTQAKFDLGTYSDTFWDTTYNEVGLTLAGRTAGVGSYTSNIKTASLGTTWSNFSWLPPEPYKKELPNNNGTESYESGNVDMTGNLGLWHLNDSDATPPNFIDNSGNGNHITCDLTCPSISSFSVFNGARNVGATGNQNFVLPANISVRNRSVFSISMWIRPTTLGGNRSLWFESTAISTSAVRFRMWSQGNKVRTQANLLDTGLPINLVVSTNDLVNNSWNHVIATFNSSTNTHRIYLNGQVTSNNVVTGTFPNTAALARRFFRAATASSVFIGAVDEIAFFDRELSPTEASYIYQRGILDVRFQIRSCSNPTCTGFNFIGPDGTPSTFYRDLDGGPLPPLFTTLPVASNKYFQYQATLTTQNSSYWPAFKKVSVDYTEVLPILAFAIRNVSDTSGSNLCQLGTATTTSLSQCQYRLKITTNATNGYTVFVETNAGLNNGVHSIEDAAVGTGGGGGHDISDLTVGTERYGAFIVAGSATSGTATLANLFNAGAVNEVRFNNSPSTTLYTVNGPNNPGVTDTVNTALITHRLNISTSTPAGFYKQKIIYTVTPNF